jgi:DNA-binding CsgD family transcriptional regulator
MGYYGRDNSHTFRWIGGVSLLKIGSLTPLEKFFAYLTTFPDPHAACAALMRGPLSPLAVIIGSIWAQYEVSELQLIGSYQTSAVISHRYGSIPMNVDVPIVRYTHMNEMGIDDLSTITQKFPVLAIDSPIWDGMTSETETRYLISVPLYASGITVGAFGFISAQSRPFIETYEPIISSLASALALWITHPRMPAHLKSSGFTGAFTDFLYLTPRQVQILLLVEQGKSNAVIAHSLGYSLSTVKQDLRRILHALRVDGRQEAVESARELGLLADTA